MAGAAREEAPSDERIEVVVGCYHVLANDIDAAIAIAKRNPEFDF